MSAVIDEAANKVTEFRAPGPGERLRSARVTQGLELAKVAAQLHLSDRMVHALESDDYAQLPDRVFVRGYLRNYARLVGLPADSILKQFDDQVPHSQESRKLNPVGASMRREVRSSHGLIRLVTWLVVLGLLGLFVVWWKGYLTWLDRAEPASTTPAVEERLPSAPTSEDGRLLLPQRGGEAVSLAPLSRSGGADPLREPRAFDPLAGTVSTAAGRPEARVPTPAAAPLSREILPETPAFTPPAAVVSAFPAVGEEGQPAAPATGVVFEFDGPCWVDVRDAKRKFKLFGEMPKGAREVLSGEPPYDVVLGNASVVRVTIDGEAYDVSRHARGNVARFRLDPTTN